MDFLVAPVRVIKQGRARRRRSSACAWSWASRTPAAAAARSRSAAPSSSSTCDFVIAAIGQNTKVSELRRRQGPELPALRRDPQPDPLADRSRSTSRPSRPASRASSPAATWSPARPRPSRRSPPGARRPTPSTATSATGKAEPEPVEFVSRKDTFRKVTAEDLRDGSRHAAPADAGPPARGAGQELRRGGAGLHRRGPAAGDRHRCLECGCAALFDCDLRRYATEYGVDIEHVPRRGEAVPGRPHATR